ncbi:MAG: FAD binding domain-containing protein [Candidatus Izemoplasmatales bacterium]
MNEYVVVDGVEEAYQLLNQDKKNQIIAGGAWLKLSVKEVNKLISLDHLSLNYINEKKDFIEIGALTTLRDIEMNPLIKDLDHGILSEAISKIMGVNIRNLATIGGSVMGKFSFSDILPVLLVMDCTLYFHHKGEMGIEEFVSTRGHERDVLTHIKIKKQRRKSFFKRVAHTALDFSMINMAIVYDKNFTISVGSQPGMAMLCKETMSFLNKVEKFTEEVIEEALGIASNELNLSSNLRASKTYRQVLVKAYLRRGIRQVIK